MKDLINVSTDKLAIKVNKEYLYCAVKGLFKCKLSKKMILSIIKYVYSKIQEQKEHR